MFPDWRFDIVDIFYARLMIQIFYPPSHNEDVLGFEVALLVRRYEERYNWLYPIVLAISR